MSETMKPSELRKLAERVENAMTAEPIFAPSARTLAEEVIAILDEAERLNNLPPEMDPDGCAFPDDHEIAALLVDSEGAA